MPKAPIKRQRVSTLVPEDLPPAAVVQKFVTQYVGHRDLKLAACQVRLMPDMGEKLYKNEKVRAMIDHKIMLVDVEEAKLKAKANLLTVPLLDASLVEEVKKKTDGHVRIKAIEMGYKRTGLIRDGEFFVQPKDDGDKKAPSIYQARQTKVTVTQEVNEVFAVREY